MSDELAHEGPKVTISKRGLTFGKATAVLNEYVERMLLEEAASYPMPLQRWLPNFAPDPVLEEAAWRARWELLTRWPTWTSAYDRIDWNRLVAPRTTALLAWWRITRRRLENARDALRDDAPFDEGSDG